jgi:hypothetical protein
MTKRSTDEERIDLTADAGSVSSAPSAPTLGDVLARLESLQEAIEHRPIVTPKFVGIGGASVYCSLSAESIRGLIAAGKLTALRPVRGRIVLAIEELDAFVRSSTSSIRGGRGSRAKASTNRHIGNA